MTADRFPPTVKPNWWLPVPSATRIPFFPPAGPSRKGTPHHPASQDFASRQYGRQTGLRRRKLFIGQGLARPRPLPPSGLHWLWAPPRMRGGGGPGCGRVFRVAPSLLQPRCLCGSGAALPALAAREKGGDRRSLCVLVRGAAVPAVPLARGGRPG